MSASLIAKLQLDIAGYQAALAESQKELKSFTQRSVREVDQVAAAQKRLNQALKNTGVAVPKVNPWSTAALGSEDYLEKLKAVAKEEKLMQQYQLHAAAKAGSSAVNPWTTAGAPAYQLQQQQKEAQRLQQIEAERQAQAAAAQQRLLVATEAAQQRAAAQAAAEMSALQRKQALEISAQRRANQGAIDGRLQLQLIEARISGNAKEVSQLETRLHLLQQMRTIQQQTGVSQREAYMLSQRMGVPVGAAKGGGNFALGNVALQAQDIAVQMQMGAKASTIIAQQGSQMLSVFGTGGAIAGGVLAIGGMFYAMGEAAKKAFKEAEEAQKEFEEKGREAVASGSVPTLIKFTEEASVRVRDLRQQLDEAFATRTAGDVISEWAGGPSFNEKYAQKEAALKASEEAQRKATEALMTNSEREKDIALLRAEGRDKEADQMMRQIAYAKELQRISRLDLDSEQRARLENNALDKVYAEQQRDERQEREKQTKKIEAAQKKLDDARQKAAEQQMTLEERIADVRLRLQQGGAQAGDQESEIEAQTQKVELQIELNRLLEEQKRSVQEAANEIDREVEAEKRAADERQRYLDQQIKIREERKKQQIMMDKARNDSLMDIEVLRLRARGQDKAADKLEREKRIAEQAAKIRQETGASEAQALKMARERADLEDKLQRRLNGEPGHIGGVKERHMMGGSGMKSALDEFRQNQLKRPLLPGEKPPPGYKAGDLVPVHSGGLDSRGRGKGRMMGGEDAGAISERTARVAGAQDARETKDTSGLAMAGKILDVVTRGLIG